MQATVDEGQFVMAEEETKPKRGLGRPPKIAAERKRLNRTFRINDIVNERLVDAAKLNQRSVSEEIEARLEYSFLENDLVLAMSGGEKLATLLTMIALIVKTTKNEDGKIWNEDPNCS